MGESDDVEGSECDGDFVAAVVERTAKSASVGLTSLQAAAVSDPVNPAEAAYLSVSFWLRSVRTACLAAALLRKGSCCRAAVIAVAVMALPPLPNDVI